MDGRELIWRSSVKISDRKCCVTRWSVGLVCVCVCVYVCVCLARRRPFPYYNVSGVFPRDDTRRGKENKERRRKLLFYLVVGRLMQNKEMKL